MPQAMNAVLVLIASPSDAIEERASVRDVLIDWNIDTGRRMQVVALPWLYERHAVAKMGPRAQAIINAQAVDQADVVVAFFDARLGTDTGVDVSGTAEEINRAREMGKPVHVYFSAEPLPRDVDPEQLAALNDFKATLGAEGLLGTYNDPRDLAGQVRRALQLDVDENAWGDAAPSVKKNTGAVLTWRHAHTKEPNGVDSKGKPKTRTTENHLVVRNDGEVAVEDLTFDVKGLDDSLTRFDGPDEAITLYPHSELRWFCLGYGSGIVQITARWTENGTQHDHIRTVSLV